MIKAVMSTESAATGTRLRILRAASALIRAEGPDAATTRAVAAAASVQAPTIYRLFGDKNALLDAVAEHELTNYVAAKKHQAPHSNPVEALEIRWDRHVAFGLANPGLYWIMSRNASSPAAIAGIGALAEGIHAIALAGRLRGSEERAVSMVHAACVGTVLALLAGNKEKKQSSVSDDTRAAVLAAITLAETESILDGVRAAATTLQARLAEQRTALTPGERALLGELLNRLSNGV